VKLGCIIHSWVIASIPDWPRRLADLECRGVLWLDASPADDGLRWTGLQRCGLRVIGLGRFGLGGGGAAERKSDVRGFAVHVSAARAAGAEAVVVTGASRSSEHLKAFLATLDELIPGTTCARSLHPIGALAFGCFWMQGSFISRLSIRVTCGRSSASRRPVWWFRTGGAVTRCLSGWAG